MINHIARFVWPGLLCSFVLGQGTRDSRCMLPLVEWSVHGRTMRLICSSVCACPSPRNSSGPCVAAGNGELLCKLISINIIARGPGRKRRILQGENVHLPMERTQRNL